MKLNRREQAVVVSASLSFLVSFLMLRLSGFSASVLVNLQNYIIKTMILNTSGMSTLSALAFAAKPFVSAFVALVFLALGISILSAYGYSGSERKIGKISGIAGALFAIALFPSIWGAFLAAAVLLCSFFAVQFANTYGKEVKRWTKFRVGSNTAGKMFFILNIIIAVGLFFAVLHSQPLYEVSFKGELLDSMKSIALYLPGASSIPPAVLSQKIESAVSSSPLFGAYIRWLPASTAFSAWVILEMLRNIILANLSGLFTFAILRKSK